MCGIVGTLNIEAKSLVNPDNLCSMLGAVRHRGPDQFGVYVYQDGQSGVGLGSARLSIIDLGGGQQPISNEDGTVWIVFNGEIFNYLELREALARDGHRLSTDSDTEVIVHLYEHVGPACVDYLNGQFTFAIWDERTHTLFMARDRLGIRPLYYTVQDGALLFASEVKALLADSRVPAEIDPVTLDQIFTFWSPLSPRTPFKGIQTLPPGHWMLARPKGDIQIERYWEPSFSKELAPEENVEDFESAARRLRHLLVDATQLRLRADVPVGAYLSGGLDSSTIAALIRRHTSNRLETFSIAFTDEDYDESRFQRRMAEHLGTRHHLITCTHEEIGRVFPDVIWHTETPIMRTSPAPLYLLSKLVHDHDFKVVLTGEGADEFLAGYNIFKEAKIRRFWARQPDSEMRPALLRRLYPYIGQLAAGNTAYLQRFFGQGLTDVGSPVYSHAIRWRNTGRTRRFFSRALQEALVETSASSPDDVYWPDDFGEWNWLSRAQYLEISVFLAEYLLSSQGDRMAMAHSVEGRFPFLDHRVAEFCNQLPPHFKLRGLNEKYLLKRAMRDLLPEEIWKRAKRPYRAPIHRSFFPDGKPLEWVAELLSTEQVEAAGYFNPRAVDKLLQKIDRFGALGETDDMALAGLLSTQLLHRQFVADYRLASPIDTQDDVKIVLRGNAQERAAALSTTEEEAGALTPS
ncbi:MAG: asparagine synthase (glutamine-hydrolyzing) [Candidatus Promineifilaceae bacterium]|nr:asparagine synthase (glutamine-hydrolyzing) [Candidatus Promineifilaceae bacterium]